MRPVAELLKVFERSPLALDLVASSGFNRRPHMTSLAPPAAEIDRQELLVFAPRQRDRRLGLGDVLMALTRTLGDRGALSLMRSAFEEVLRRVVPVRGVQLRDVRDVVRWTRTPRGGTS